MSPEKLCTKFTQFFSKVAKINFKKYPDTVEQILNSVQGGNKVIVKSVLCVRSGRDWLKRTP